MRQDALNQTLDMALKQNNGTYAAYAYGELSQLHMENGERVKAMKYAQQAVNFVLAQNDTNIFQQGFSAYYNILHELGHVDLAEKYLKKAMAIQAHFNNQAFLVVAEHNLAKVYIEKGQYQQAQDVLNNLSETQLSKSEKLATETLWALTALNMNDNITAYTKANQVYAESEVDERIRVQAGLVLISAALALERVAETEEIYKTLKKMTRPHWRFEHDLFLTVVTELSGEQNFYTIDIEALNHHQKVFMDEKARVMNLTKTPKELINKLDQYIAEIIK